jgi:hypothetical protein
MARKATIPDEVREYFRKEGARGGKRSAAGRLEKMTPEQRSEVARKAAAASAKVRSAKAAKKRAETALLLKGVQL